MIRFELPFALPTLNAMLRENHWKRSGTRDYLAWQVLAALGRQRPSSPILRARIRVERHSTGTIDPDGRDASCKSLLDVLQPSSKRHPAGLGVISNDSPGALTLVVVPVRVRRRAEQKTIVTIEEIPT
jgi:hypothetical protein